MGVKIIDGAQDPNIVMRGDPEFRPIIANLNKRGISFVYFQNGGDIYEHDISFFQGLRFKSIKSIKLISTNCAVEDWEIVGKSGAVCRITSPLK